MQNKHVIIGAGQLGLAVMDELVAQGQTVTLVNRSGLVNEPLPDGVKVVQGNATDADTVSRICSGAVVVFHCAQPPYDKWPEMFPPITQGILDGVSRTDAKLIFGDNLYMYGPTGRQPIHEDLPYAANGRKGANRAQMAKMLLAAHEIGQVRVAIGRASDFYGPRVIDSALGSRFFTAALAGKTVDLLGNVDLPHTYTYIKDFARGLVMLGEHEAALGRAWHVPNAATITTRQWVDLVAEEIGRPIKLRTAGRFIVSVMGLFQPVLREFKEMMYEFEEPYVVDHSRYAKAFGANPTPHRDAIRETVQWYR